LSDVLNGFGLSNPNASIAFDAASASPTPEPASLGVLAIGALALLARRQSTK
jgi:hypothetical protein